MTPTIYYYDIAVDKPLYQLFTYKHSSSIAIGSRVIVPFIKKSKLTGIVVRQNPNPQFDLTKIKSIEAILDNEPILTNQWLELTQFTANYYLYPIGQTLFASLPVNLKEPVTIKIPATPVLYKLNQNAALAKAPQARFILLVELWNTLKKSYISLEEANYIHPQAKKYLQKWQQQGLISQQERIPPNWIYQRKTLNPEQQNAAQKVIQDLNQFKPYLLFGITGSGKTEVYFEVINQAILQKKQVLMLLPIINLTPQLFARMKQTFPHAEIALLHSKVAQQTRLHHYLTARFAKAQIILGTRLAVFTPIPNLGLIIVDEEHDESFKQTNELRYNARDLAIWRAHQSNCPIILGSATPSIETWYKAQTQQYSLLNLSRRASHQANLPDIKLIKFQGKKPISGFSNEVIAAIQQNFNAKNLTLVYLNRRGYATTLICFDCAHVFCCKNCSAKMVYHKQQNKLKCHHCDYEMKVPSHCPECGNQDLTPLGLGTEKVEQALHQICPKANIVRVDSDSLSQKKSWHHIYEQIQNDEIDILVGTQILAKGHDFKKLSLVVILNADNSLYSANFRASETLFGELMQVSGRAGRSNIKGNVLIQTQFPNHELFTAIQQHDYPKFANQQLKERLELNFPPQTHQIIIRAEHQYLTNAEAFLSEFKTRSTAPPNIRKIGPLPMSMMRLANKERAILYFESENRLLLHNMLKNNITLLYQLQKTHKNIKWVIDVDPHEV